MNSRDFQIGPGAASLLLIAVVLCMSVLGVLSLVSAQSDARLSDRAAMMAQSAAELSAKSERSLATLDAVLVSCQGAEDNAAYLDAVEAALPAGMKIDLHVVSWRETTENGRGIECEATIERLGEFPRVRFMAHKLYTEMDEEEDQWSFFTAME